MSLRTCLGLAITATFLPVLAFAAPANVTGITATAEGGNVRVTWQQVSGNVASYRVFYSHASILENDGTYDDFVTVDGSVNTTTLQNLPPVTDLYVSVLAVDSTGAESPFFVEETRVTLGTAAEQSSRSSSVSSSSASSTSTTSVSSLRLLGVDVLSATGIVLHFSQRVTIPAAQATQAIMIQNASGMTLQLRRFVVQGNDVTVHTEVQERGTVYRVTIGSVVTAANPDGTVISMAADQSPMLFTGHASGKAPVATPTQPTQTVTGDVSNLRLRAEPNERTYTVEAAWQAPQGVVVMGYDISQTTDGRTYGNARKVNNGTTTIRIPGVPAGTFGIRVRILLENGSYTAGANQLLQLPALSSTVTGNVSQGSEGLTNSGPALWLAISSMGAALGTWGIQRRRKMLA